MKQREFILEIERIVAAGTVLGEKEFYSQLRKLYHRLREEFTHDIATAIEQRDKALEIYHKTLTNSR